MHTRAVASTMGSCLSRTAARCEPARLTGLKRDTAPFIGTARVERVIDGDTAVLRLELPLLARPLAVTCRFVGLDAPELKACADPARGRSPADAAEERRHAYATRLTVADILTRAEPFGVEWTGLDCCRRFLVQLDPAVRAAILANTPTRLYTGRQARVPVPRDLLERFTHAEHATPAYLHRLHTSSDDLTVVTEPRIRQRRRRTHADDADATDTE